MQNVVEGFSVGLGIGLLVGGFLAYKYAGTLLSKAIAEYDKLKLEGEKLIHKL